MSVMHLPTSGDIARGSIFLMMIMNRLTVSWWHSCTCDCGVSGVWGQGLTQFCVLLVFRQLDADQEEIAVHYAKALGAQQLEQPDTAKIFNKNFFTAFKSYFPKSAYFVAALSFSVV